LSLNTAVYAWLNADTTITGLVGTRLYHGLPPEDLPDTETGATLVYWRTAMRTERTLNKADLMAIADYVVFCMAATPDSADALSEAVITRMFAGIKQASGGYRIENVELLDSAFQAESMAEGISTYRNEFRISMI